MEKVEDTHKHERIPVAFGHESTSASLKEPISIEKAIHQTNELEYDDVDF